MPNYPSPIPGIGYPTLVESDHDVVWAEMPEGGLLHDLFGYWPSFHNSELKSIHFDPSADQLVLTMDYTDESAERDAGLMAFVELIFSGIQSLEMELRNYDIMNLRFRKPGDFIETEIDFGDGCVGKIVSEAVDASIKQLNPNPDEARLGMVRLTYHRRA